jgi:membrane-associated phospholipid phosphatase
MWSLAGNLSIDDSRLMRQIGKNKTILILVVSIFLLPTSYAQMAPGGRPSGTSDKADRLSPEEEEFKKRLATLDDQPIPDAVAPPEGVWGQPTGEPPREPRQSAEVGSRDIDNREPLPTEGATRSLERNLVPNMLVDQKDFWTGPLRMRPGAVHWLVHLAAFTSALIGSDTSIEKAPPTNSTLLKRSRSFSNLGAASLVGTAGAFYFWGRSTHHDHAREAGLLSGEALANSVLVSSLVKVATGRDRPFDGNGQGRFGHGGTSFPSDHAAAAWSIATVLAHEYPGPLTKLLAYGTASAVSVSRVTGRKHFTSDVFIGSALGWYLGRQVYRAHHSRELSGAEWNTSAQDAGENLPRPENMGSPYVPLDSWVYPAFDRLAALGYVQSAFLGIRPWTRMECARLLGEASERLPREGDKRGEGQSLYAALAQEFVDETARFNGSRNVGVSLDSIYARTTQISGTPLRDGYHFGQTIVNDFGRPYWTGFNAVAGGSAHALAGPLAFYVRGEYQRAPAVPSQPALALAATAAADGTPVLANPIAPADRFRLLDATVSVKLGSAQLSLGKQSAWLGPGTAGPLLFTDNAEPMMMLKIDAVSPYRIPRLSRLLGPVRSEFFIGQLSGQVWQFSPSLFGPDLRSQPMIHATKLSFKPTPNLEIGAGFTAQFGGPGNPVTWRNFARTFYSHRARGDNPGKRLSELSLSYRVPGLRDWLVLYTDSMVIDEYSPLGSNRPAINPGVYLPQLPKIRKLELRLEGVTTDLNVPLHYGVGAFYWDSRYRSGYTHGGNLLGNWVGRRGRGEQAWATYWFSPRNTIQFGYRHNNVDKGFVGGGRLRDLSFRTDLRWRRDLGVSALVQFEDWAFPVLSPTTKSNVTGWLQLTWWPTGWKK